MAAEEDSQFAAFLQEFADGDPLPPGAEEGTWRLSGPQCGAPDLFVDPLAWPLRVTFAAGVPAPLHGVPAIAAPLPGPRGDVCLEFSAAHSAPAAAAQQPRKPASRKGKGLTPAELAYGRRFRAKRKEHVGGVGGDVEARMHAGAPTLGHVCHSQASSTFEVTTPAVLLPCRWHPWSWRQPRSSPSCKHSRRVARLWGGPHPSGAAPHPRGQAQPTPQRRRPQAENERLQAQQSTLEDLVQQSDHTLTLLTAMRSMSLSDSGPGDSPSASPRAAAAAAGNAAADAVAATAARPQAAAAAAPRAPADLRPASDAAASACDAAARPPGGTSAGADSAAPSSSPPAAALSMTVGAWGITLEPNLDIHTAAQACSKLRQDVQDMALLLLDVDGGGQLPGRCRAGAGLRGLGAGTGGGGGQRWRVRRAWQERQRSWLRSCRPLLESAPRCIGPLRLRRCRVGGRAGAGAEREEKLARLTTLVDGQVAWVFPFALNHAVEMRRLRWVAVQVGRQQSSGTLGLTPPPSWLLAVVWMPRLGPRVTSPGSHPTCLAGRTPRAPRSDQGGKWGGGPREAPPRPLPAPTAGPSTPPSRPRSCPARNPRPSCIPPLPPLPPPLEPAPQAHEPGGRLPHAPARRGLLAAGGLSGRRGTRGAAAHGDTRAVAQVGGPAGWGRCFKPPFLRSPLARTAKHCPAASFAQQTQKPPHPPPGAHTHSQCALPRPAHCEL
jgi:hypothetical protein